MRTAVGSTMTGLRPLLPLAVLLVLLGPAAAGASDTQPGLLARAADLLGWGAAASTERDPSLVQNATAVVERFQARLRSSVAERLRAVLSVHLSTTGRQHSRTRRSISDGQMSTRLVRDEQGVDVLVKDHGAKKVWDIPAPGAQHVHVFKDNDKTYAVAAFGKGSNTSGLYELQNNTWTELSSFSSFGALEFTSFENSDGLNVIGAEYDGADNRADKRGSILYLLREGQLRLRHVLPAAYPTDVEIWNDYDTFHIGVASEHEVLPDKTKTVNYHVNSSVFQWADGNFRQYSLPTHGARDIEHFRMNSHSMLAIANHQNNDGSLNVHSEILRYSLETGRYRPFQRLLTHGAVRVRHFSWGRGVTAEHFLVVANQGDRDFAREETNHRVNSVVYKFSQSQFVPFQCLPTVRARDVLPVWGPSGQFVLALLDDTGLSLYQYTGWRFALVHRVPLPAATDGDGDSRLSAFTHDGEIHLTVGSVGPPAGLPAVYRLRFARRRDLAQLHSACTARCSEMRTDLAQLQPRVDELRVKLQKAPQRNQSVAFRSLTVHSEKHSHFSRVVVDNVHLRENVTLNSGQLKRLDNLQTRLQDGLSNLTGLRQRLEGAVSTDDHHHFSQTVTVTGSWRLSTAAVQNLHLQRLNDIGDVAAFLSGLVWTDQAFEDRAARLKFARLVLQGKANLTVGTLSHVRPSSLVTLTGDHVITTSKVLLGHVTAEGDVKAGLVNGLRIAEDTVLKQGLLPAGVTQFSDLTVSDLRVRHVNAMDVWSVMREAVSASGGRLPDSVTFAGPVSIRSANLRTINNISVERLLERAFTTNGGQNVTGAWTVGRLHIDTDLVLTDTLNGMRLPDDFVLLNRPELSFSLGRLSFSSVTVHQLTVTERLGPVRVSEGSLQLLLTSGDQLVTGRKTLGSLHLTSDSTVSGLVNGVNVSSSLVEAPLDQTDSTIEGDKLIGGDVVILSDLHLSGRLNGLDAPRLLRSALKLTDAVLPSMVFSGGLEISGDLRTSHLNHISPSNIVTTDSSDQIITGDKALLSLSAGGITVDRLNGLQLDGFYGSVLRTEGDQRVRGPVVFAADVVFDDLTATSVDWDGHNLTEAVTVTGDHVITGTKLYSAPLQVAQLQVTDLWVDGRVDGANLTALLNRSTTVVNTTYMTVTGSQRFTSRVTASTLVVTGAVNGDALLETLRDAVRDGVVTGELVLDAPVTVQRLEFTGLFDGVTAGEFGADWLTSAGGQTISGPLRVTAGATLTAPALVVGEGGRLNGVEGRRLLEGRVRLQPGLVIRQNVTIESIVAADVTLELEGTNFTDVMRQNQSQLVLGSKEFRGGVHALGRLAVPGTVNGFPLSGLCERVVLRDAPNTFDRLTVNGDVTLRRVARPLSWTVDGVPLSRLEEHLWLRDANQTLTGDVTLARPYFTAVDGVQTLLSGSPPRPVNLEPYLLHYWSRRRPENVTGAVTFLGGVTLGRLEADSLTVLGQLNGQNLSAVRHSTLTVGGGTVTGEWTLPDLIVTDELTFASLSGVAASALLRTDGTEGHFTAHQTVRQMAVRGDVILLKGGRVFGLHVPRELDMDNFLTRQPGPVVVTSDVIFGSQTVNFTQPLTIHGTVNGLRLDRSSLLTLGDRQRVPGVTRVTHVGGRCLEVADLTTPYLNGVDVSRLINHAVRLHGSSSEGDRPLEITGHWNFTHRPSALGYYAPRSHSERRMAQLLHQVLGELQRLRAKDLAAAGDRHLAVFTGVRDALRDARARLREASYLQYYVSLQRWRSPIVRLQPVFLEGAGGRRGPPAFLAAVWPERVQLLSWQPADSFGRWVDGPRYPERRVSCMAGMRRLDGTAHVAEARLAEPPTGVKVPDRVYRWDDPALHPLGDAVNYIFLYHRDVLTQSLAMPSHNTVDVKSLRPSPEHACFLFVHFALEACHLVCHSDAEGGFVLHQTIPTRRARQASVYTTNNSTCVAVAGGGRVDLWCWEAGRALLARRQTIAAAAVGVDTAEVHGRTLMAVTRADPGKLAGLVDVYGLEPDSAQFRHLQTVPVWAVRSARLLLLPSDELLLACLTADGRIVYLHHRGPAGFEPRGQLAVGHAATLEMFNMDGLATQLTVAGRPAADMFDIEEHYPAAAFAGKFMGHKW